MCTGLVLRAKQTTSHIITKAQGRACKSALVWYWEPPSLLWFNRALRRHSCGTVMLWNHRAEAKTTFVSSVNCELQLNVVPKKLSKSKCGGELKLSTTSNMVLLCWVKSRHRCHSSSSERHLKKVQCCSKSEKCATYIFVGECIKANHAAQFQRRAFEGVCRCGQLALFVTSQQGVGWGRQTIRQRESWSLIGGRICNKVGQRYYNIMICNCLWPCLI